MSRPRISVALAAIVLASVFASPARAGNVRKAAALIPGNHEVLLGADVDRLRNAPLFQSLMDKLEKEGGEDFRKFVAQSKLDLRRDIDTMVAGMRNKDDVVVVVHGKIDFSALMKAAEKEVTAETYLGQTLLVGKDAAMASVKGYVVFGPPDLVKEVIDVSQGKRAAVTKSPLGRDFAANPGTAALSFSMITTGAMGKDVTRDMPDLASMRGWMSLAAGGVNGEVVLDYKNAEAAKKTHEMLKTGLDAAKNSNPGDPAGDIMRAVQASVSGSRIKVGAKLTAEQVKMIAGLLGL